MIVEGENGLLVPRRQPEALARALASVLDDQPLRQSLAAGARRSSAQRFGADDGLDQMLKVYEAVGSS